MEYCSLFQIGHKNSSFIVLLIVSFATLHQVYSSVSALYHAYCSVLSSSPWKLLLYHWYIPVLGSSRHILSCFVLLHIFFWCILFLDILLIITFYCNPPFIMLHYSTTVIWATSGIIRVQVAIICLLLLQLSCIISSCRLLFIRLSIQDDDISCRTDHGDFIFWVYIPSKQSKCWHVHHTSWGWLWHIVAWLGQVSYLLGVGSLIILPCSCSVMNMILWHDYYLFSKDSAEVGWHLSSVLLILVSFSSFIVSDCGMMVLA